MEQFSLKEYLKNPKRKIITRNGYPARIICTDADSGYCVIGLVYTSNREEVAVSYYANGTRWTDSDSESDLFFASEKKVCSFKRGDRVLARDSDTSWNFDYFDSYREESFYPYICKYTSYEQCIPLNEHTWKLLGTTNEYNED